AKKESWVTTLTPKLSLTYTAGAHFNAAGFYTPDIAFFHSAHSEDHVAHRLGLTFNGSAGELIWEQANSFAYIDGDEAGPMFARPQDVPAIGGIPLRDRREGLTYRGSFKLAYALGKFFLRPVASAYIHDFRTEQKLSTAVPQPYFYVNYNDRQDVNGGLDLGYKIAETTSLIAGYRYGRQDQFRGPSVFDPARFADSPYDSEYHRILLGIEGTPVPWLRLAVLAGPDFRNWRNTTPSGFDRDEMLYWIDATATLLPTKSDTVVLLNRRFEQPAFTSQSVYEDITYSVTWRHKFSDRVSGSAAFQLYIGDWQAPVQREDWIYTPSASLTYAYDKHLTAELSYSYDWVENKVPTNLPGATYAEGREFTRHIVCLTLRYSF
ncbi:MAG: outer membrane beta-barrel protein, partial [Verrucomicrobiales bacterium]|nr:outer membrane beta-barrel protein [Verrucomicrobiales bacterium]